MVERSAQHLEIIEIIERVGIVPVLTIDDESAAQDLCDALIDGGSPLVEITLRTPAAIPAIRTAAADARMLVGAGTALSVAQVDAAAEAGARFVVSPGTGRAVIERCQELELLCIPGAATPTEVMNCMELGLDVLKFFPAEGFGGTSVLRDLMLLFPEVRFVATGGITPENTPDYLAVPAVLAVGTNWMATRPMIQDRDWASVRRITAETTALRASLA